MATQEKNALPARYYRFARMALELATIYDNGMLHQLCALVVNKNKVLAVGYNSRKTHTIVSDTAMQMLHAECDSILRCPTDALDGVDLVIARARPSGKPGLAKPCEVCEGIIKRCGIRRVYYTTNSENIEFPEIEEMRL
jgi:tRNA(Arg) A34 adenosine deaminase TadA